MPIHVYQSKKVQRYIGDNDDMDMPWASDQVDPLTLWYADVFFINRERYIVIVNPLTKFTFFIFRYTKKTLPSFLAAFNSRLSASLRAIDINPTKYLEQSFIMVPYTAANKSASSHLSRIKTEYGDMIKSRYHDVYPPEDEAFYNKLVTDDITSYHNTKDYDFPKKRFLHELLLRRWA